MLKKEAPWERIFIALGTALVLIRLIPLLAAMAVSLTEETRRSDFALVGIQHYIDLLTDTTTFRSLRNTIGQAVLGGGLTALASAILVWCLVQIPKRVQTAILIVLAIPALIPSAFFSILICDLCSSTGALGSLTGIICGSSFNLLAKAKIFPAISAAAEALRTAFYPTLLGVTLIKEADTRKILRLTLCYFLVRVLLMPDMLAEVTNQIHNPPIHETSDTLATISIREGFYMSNYGRSSALDIIRYALAALAVVPGMKLVRSACRPEARPATAAKPCPALAITAAMVMTFPALAFCLYAFHYGFSSLPQLLRHMDACHVDMLEFFASTADDWLFEAVSSSIFAGAAFAVFAGATVFVLAYALMRRDLKFLLVAALCWSPVTGVESLLWKSLGFIGKDISWPFLKLIVFQSMGIGIPLLGAIALAEQLKGREFRNLHDYFNAALPSLMVIALSAFCLRYGTQLYYGQSCISNRIYDLLDPGCMWMPFTDSTGHTLEWLQGSDLNYYEMAYRAYAFIGSLPGLAVGLIPLALRDRLPVELMCTGIRR